MRWIVGGEAVLGAAASPSQMGRFERGPLVPPGLDQPFTGWPGGVSDQRSPVGPVPLQSLRPGAVTLFRRGNDFTPRLHGRRPEGSVCSCWGEVSLDVECVV